VWFQGQRYNVWVEIFKYRDKLKQQLMLYV